MHHTTHNLGLSTSYFGLYGAEEASRLAAAGIHHIEYSMPSQRFELGLAVHREDLELARSASEPHGITLHTYHIPYGDNWDPSVLDPEQRVANLARILELATMVAEVWSPRVGFILHPSYEPIADEEREARMTTLLQVLPELCAGLEAVNPDVRWLIEDLPRSCLGKNSAEILRITDADERLAVCFDVNHLLVESNAAFLRAVGPRIATCHLSDYDQVNERHWAPGRGINDWPALLAGMRAAGYTGPWVYELGPGSVEEGTFTLEDLVDNYHQVLGGD